MSRIKRMSVALVLALIMVMALAGTALAFDPPDHNNGEPGGVAPWLATNAGPSPGKAGPGPIEFADSCA